MFPWTFEHCADPAQSLRSILKITRIPYQRCSSVPVFSLDLMHWIYMCRLIFVENWMVRADPVYL